MNPGEKHNRPGRRDVEGDVLVELDNAVQGRLSEQRNQGSANGEENDADIDVEDQRRGSGNDECEAKDASGLRQAVFEAVVNASKAEDQGVGENEDEDESARHVSKLGLLTCPISNPMPFSVSFPTKGIAMHIHSSVTLINHPSIEFLSVGQLLLLLLCHLSRKQHPRQGRPSGPLRLPLIALILFVSHCR